MACTDSTLLIEHTHCKQTGGSDDVLCAQDIEMQEMCTIWSHKKKVQSTDCAQLADKTGKWTAIRNAHLTTAQIKFEIIKQYLNFKC